MQDEKRVPYRNKKILQAARGEECTINSPVCNYDPSTVVACHSNSQEDGKGMGQKADDCFVAFGCSACHKWLDENVWYNSDNRLDLMEKAEYFHRAMKKTLRRLLDMGVLK